MTSFLNWRWAILGAFAITSASTCAPLGAAEAATEAGATEAAIPGVAAGWPQVLRGSIIGTPVAADLDGDGKLEVVASAMHRRRDRNLVSPEPTIAAQLWAFGGDGKSVNGWPLTVKTVEQRQAMYDDKGFAPWADNWYASPSVWDVNDDGSSEIILNTAGHGTNAARGNIVILYADGGLVPLGFGGSDWASAPLADLDGDEIPDLVLDKVLMGVNGRPVRDWPMAKVPQSGYQPTVGDADGDGQPEIFMPSSAQEIWGLNNKGEPLPGWPRKVSPYATYIVMGDVAGDAKKEIISVDFSQNLRVWNFDGTSVKLAPEIQAPNAQFLDVEKRAMRPGAPDDLVMATNMGGFAPPCLADLDGDGKAEILTLGDSSQGVFAWRGDGRPFMSNPRGKDEPLPKILARSADGKGGHELDPNTPADRERLEKYDARQRRGRIATLPWLNARAHSGVTVVDLGGDGVMDIFAGTQWIKLAKDGTTQLTEMVPPAPQPPAPVITPKMQETVDKLNAQRAKEGKPPVAIEQFGNGNAFIMREVNKDGRPLRLSRTEQRNWSNDGACSVVDIDGDGNAEVLFGLSDGRLFVYRTGMSLKLRDAQWPTSSSNFQNTGVWNRAK